MRNRISLVQTTYGSELHRKFREGLDAEPESQSFLNTPPMTLDNWEKVAAALEGKVPPPVLFFRLGEDIIGEIGLERNEDLPIPLDYLDYDIKILPSKCGKGLGTETTRLFYAWVEEHTGETFIFYDPSTGSGGKLTCTPHPVAMEGVGGDIACNNIGALKCCTRNGAGLYWRIAPDSATEVVAVVYAAFPPLAVVTEMLERVTLEEAQKLPPISGKQIKMQRRLT